MKKTVLIIIFVLIVSSLFAYTDSEKVQKLGDFYAFMSLEETYFLIGDRVLIEKYSGSNYTRYDFGDIILYYILAIKVL